MTLKSKAFVWAVVAAGVIVLALSAEDWKSASDPRFLVYLALTLVAAALKVRLPRVEGTISVSFVFLVAAAGQFHVFQCALLAAPAAIVQCLWRPRRKPMAIQVAFSAAVLVLSVTVARTLTMLILQPASIDYLVAFTAIAAVLFYATDTFLVATIVCLVESRPLVAVWEQCHLWAFPYYLCGALLLEATATVAGRSAPDGPIVLLPLTALAHLCYRSIVSRAPVEERSTAATANH